MHRVRRIDLPFRGHSYEFEGTHHGAVQLSVMLFDGPPGSGPKPHRHPYDEVLFVREGRARLGHGLFAETLTHRLLDTIHVDIHPVLVGGGRPFFREGQTAILKLTAAKVFSKVVRLRFEPQYENAT